MKYSQNNEEAVIGSYFGAHIGTLLSLGENDGETLSNSRALIKRGWGADLIEPAPVVFENLSHLYSNNEKVSVHNVAVGNEDSKMPFYDSGSLLGQGDQSLVSTLSTDETKRWGTSVDFNTIQVDVITVASLLEKTQYKTFDFISIDCEGYDLDILRQLDLDALQTKCVCVEFNGKGEAFYYNHVRRYGFRLLHKNAENLIYVR